MLSAIWALIKAGAAALGWAKQASDIETGRKLQAGADAIAAQKDDQDAQAIDRADSALSDDALDARLRRPGSNP